MKMTFIVGTGRCGSTLLHEIIAKHKDASFISNIEEKHGRLGFLGKWGNTLYRNNSLALTRSGANRFAPSEGYRLIARNVSPIYVRPCRDLTSEDVSPWMKARFSEFFEKRYVRYGKPVFTHKYTGWSRIGFFSTIFPEAKFVHIVRDGRAVASSWLQMKWWGGYEGPENWFWGVLSDDQKREWENSHYSFATLAGLNWKILTDSYDKSSRLLDQNRYMVVKYEDFLNEPIEQLKNILQFSELEWSPDFENQFKKFNIRKSRKSAYKKDLNAQQLTDLERSLAGKLAEYGYK